MFRLLQYKGYAHSDVVWELLVGGRAEVFHGYKNIGIIDKYSNGYEEITFYRRRNKLGIKEVGIYYGPGFLCQSKDREKFSPELLRFRSFDERCLWAARHWYYFSMIKNQIRCHAKFS